jgi:hypothetical protein
MLEGEKTYKVIRYWNKMEREELVLTGLTEEEAHNYCNAQENKGNGYFCGYMEE